MSSFVAAIALITNCRFCELTPVIPIDANISTVNSVAGISPVDTTKIALMMVSSGLILEYSSTSDRAFTSSTSLSNAAFPDVSIVLNPRAAKVDSVMAVLLLSRPSAPARTAIYAVTAA